MIRPTIKIIIPSGDIDDQPGAADDKIIQRPELTWIQGL